MLRIKDLDVNYQKKSILKGVNFSLKEGEIHLLMGPNGAGKSSLALALMGHPDYQIKKGEIIFRRKKINKLSPDQRAKLGLYLAFQNPLEFEGIKLFSFLKESHSKLSKEKLDSLGLLRELKKNLKLLLMKEEFIERYLNFGFSGGEKKKSEIFQLSILKPKLAILDEIDSGLDIDSFKAVTKFILNLKKSFKTSFLIISHLPRFVKFLKPDFVHIMVDGKIVKSGDYKLAKYVEKYGYKNF